MSPEHERRKFKRVSLTHATVEVVDSGGSIAQPERCTILNVSENGMLLMAECPVDLFSVTMQVRLTFTLPGTSVIIRTNASVIYVQEKDLSQFIGLQFKNLGDRELEYLIDFVKNSAG